MKAIRRQGGFGRFAGAAAAILRLVVLMGVGVAPPASAALPRFTSAVELKGLSGEPAGIRDPEIQRIDPVSAGYGAAGTLNGGPVRWDANGTATSLPLPDVYNGGYVYVYGANNAGQVVGTVAPGRAIRWEADGSPTMLGPPAPDGYAFFAYGINNVGQAVGVSGTPTLNSRGTRWAADGSCTVLADVPGLTTTHSAAYNISDTGIAVGYFEVPDYSRYPVRWAADGSATLLGAPPRPRGTATYAVGVNNAGEAVGYTDLGVGSRAVRWAVDGSATGLADLPGHAIDSSVALGITNGGLIGGSQFEADVNNNYVVLWDADGTPARLQDLMADGNTWRFWEFDGIDSDATTVRVLAIGSKNGGPPNYYLVEGHVPEPASLSLLAVAALILRRPRPARRRISETQERVADNPRTAFPPAARAIAIPVVAALLVACGGTDARAAWSYVNLHPTGGPDSSALFGVGDGQQVGYTGGTTAPTAATLWKGAAGSFASLSPPGSMGHAYGVSQGRQVGGLFSSDGEHAILWNGAAGSAVNLQPAATYSSEARGIRGNQQVGWVIITPDAVSQTPHASLWSGTAASWVDLHPAGAISSIAYGVDANQQVGQATPLNSHGHASLWTGTAASWVDLEPPPAPGVFPIVASVANAVQGGQQAGTLTFRLPDRTLIDHAGYWRGTAASWVDLTPDPTNLFAVSRANGMFGGYQVGQVETSSDVHAGIWHGTADSFVDLGALLPANYIGSNAFGVWTDGQTIQVAGVAYNFTLGRSEAILWSNAVPEPASILAILLPALLLLQTRRR